MMANQEGTSGGVVGIRGEFELTYPTENWDVEVGCSGEPRNEKKWWHRITQQNKTNIPDTVQILLDCKEKGQKLSNQHPPSIYMIPSSLRDLSPSSFNPQVVSIGPLHRKNKKLQEFEEQKATYLHHLLDRLDLSSPREILDACLQRVNASIHKIRACYGGMITYRDDELAKMMVMDACFILGFLFPTEEHRSLISRNVILERSIFHDLVLLENQIPFFVLQGIFECTISNLQTSSLTSGVLQRLHFLNPFKGIGNNDVVGTTPHHILGLLQKSFHPRGQTRNIPSINDTPSFTLPNHSAVQLNKAGVKFKPNADENWPMAIDFSSRFKCLGWYCWGNRTLRMPAMCVDDNTELFLRNVIAYEQCTLNVPDYVTSYACAIDMLVDTKEDISKLVKSKVLSNNLGSNKAATNMLNNISKQFVFKEFYYVEQWLELDRHYLRYWPKNITRLKRIYFKSPWSIIALFAGIILFALAIVQTILRIMQ